MFRRPTTKAILCCLLIMISGCMPALSSEDLPIESDHPYSNNEKKTWIINRSGVDEMKLHFEYIRLAPSGDPNYYNWDRIILSDKYDNVLAIYEGIVGGPSMVPMAVSNAKDIWTSWYPEDTIKVTLVTNGEGFDDGFKIDDVQTRSDETIENSENVDPNSSKTLEPPKPQPDSTVKDKVLTTTEITPLANSSTLGQSIMFIAKVNISSHENDEPFGTVTFMDGTSLIGTAELDSGQATLTISSLSVGSHSITAKYSGDINFKPSTSPASTITVSNSIPEQQLSHETSTPSVTPISPTVTLTTQKEETHSFIRTFGFLNNTFAFIATLFTIIGGYIAVKDRLDKK